MDLTFNSACPNMAIKTLWLPLKNLFGMVSRKNTAIFFFALSKCDVTVIMQIVARLSSKTKCCYQNAIISTIAVLLMFK